MSQSFNQQAYQFHAVYQPENFSTARQWYGQPVPPPFVAADQYAAAAHHQQQKEGDSDDQQQHPHHAAAQVYHYPQPLLQGQAPGQAPQPPAESEDSSESETDDPATRVAKQLMRKGPPKSSSKTPARHDFKKSKVRVRIRQAKERFENAQHAVQEAERAFENAQQSLEEREREWKTLNEELVDELLEAEKMRPWNKVYFQLVEYKEQHGHISLAARAATNKRRRDDDTTPNEASQQETHEEYLGGWIMRQRGDRNKGKLDEWKVLALNRLGFVWDGLESMWQNTYQKVKEFYAQHGHINITSKQDMVLNRWLKTQRATYKDYKNSGFAEPGKFGCKMNRERKELLDALGMDWGDEDQDDNWWMEPYQRLRQVQRDQGHLRTLPNGETVLIEFVKRQRAAYKKFLASGCMDSFEMTAERVSLLNSIQFPWTGTTTPFCGTGCPNNKKKRATKKQQANGKDDNATVVSHYNPWMTQYYQVKAFCQKYGHLKYSEETQAESPQEVEKMSKWDALQRKFHEGTAKKKYLTPERMELLNDIKFFQPKHELEFGLRVAQLRKFRAKHGHCLVMPEYPGGTAFYRELAVWAAQQRQQYRKLRNGSASTLTDEKVNLLGDLGFNWELELSLLHQRGGGRAAAADGMLAMSAAGKQPASEGEAKMAPVPAGKPAAEAGEEPPKKRKRGRPRKNK